MVSAGELLRTERRNRHLSLSDVEKATKIKASFLAAIERGEYQKLPSSAYAQGFVRNYAEYLDLPVRDILARFRREFDTKKEVKVLPEGFARGDTLTGRKVRVRRRVLAFFGIIVLAIGFLLYQFRFAVLNPPLDVLTPKETAVTSQHITVTGSTEPNATVTVNDQPVTIDSNGKFMKRITLFEGPTTIIVKAKSRFGKESVIERHVEVKRQ